MDNKRTSTLGFVQGAKSVIGALDLLRTALASGEADSIEFASELLGQSAEGYASSTTRFGQFGFNELAATSKEETGKQAQLSEDLLASALIDLEVGNTLIVAGRVAGETGEDLSPDELEQARNELEQITNIIALPLGAPYQAGERFARFGFDEVPQAPEFEASLDLPSAKNTFRKQGNDLLDLLVSETQKVIKEAMTLLADVDDAKVGEALSLVGKSFSTLKQTSSLGKLIGKGVSLVADAVGKLISLIGNQNLELLKEKSAEVVEKVRQGDNILLQFLRYSFGTLKAKERIEERLANTRKSAEEIDAGSKRLMGLQAQFTERMAMAIRIIKAEKKIYAGLLTASKALAVAVAVPATVIPASTLIYAASCLAAIGYSVLCAMDFADTTEVIAFVPGLLIISSETLS